MNYTQTRKFLNPQDLTVRCRPLHGLEPRPLRELTGPKADQFSLTIDPINVIVEEFTALFGMALDPDFSFENLA